MVVLRKKVCPVKVSRRQPARGRVTFTKRVYQQSKQEEPANPFAGLFLDFHRIHRGSGLYLKKMRTNCANSPQTPNPSETSKVGPLQTLRLMAHQSWSVESP